MRIKLSGIVLLCAGVLVMTLCFYGVVKALGFHGLFLFSSEVTLPKSLDVKTLERAWIDKGRLKGSWTPIYGLAQWSYIEALPLENGGTLEIKCNQNDNYIYSVDSQGQLFYKGEAVTSTDKWPGCFLWQVRAAHLSDIGVPYVVSQIARPPRPLPQNKPNK